MKKVIISSVAIALLLLTGCSDKPTPSDSSQNLNQVKEIPAVETETVSGENESVISESSESNLDTNIDINTNVDSNEMNMASFEAKMSSIYFAFDKFNIDENMQSKIALAAKIATSDASQFMIKLEGNCDEWGSDEYNFALGLKRAEAVKKSLVAEGVEAKRITMVSYGESNPTCNDKTQECWSKNRRVDFKLLP